MSTVHKRPSEGATSVSVTSSLLILNTGDSHPVPGEKEEEQKGNIKKKNESALNNSLLTTCPTIACCLAMQINTLKRSEEEIHGE